MNLKQLEVVVQVARSGSLSRAAIVLGLAQSIVSRHVSSLERAWGDRLFERTGRGMALSDFGQRVLPEIEALLEQAGRLEQAVQGVAGVPSGIVRVGVVPSLTTAVVPALFADLQNSAPGIRLAITEGMNSRLDELLASGRLDLAITNRYAGYSPGEEDLLGGVTTYLVCAANHPFATRDTVRLADLASVPLVLPAAPAGLRDALDHHARKLGIEIHVHMEAESLTVMRQVAISGRAMTILPLCAVADEVQAGRLALVKLIEPELPRLIMLASTRQHALSRAARFVMGRLRQVVPPLLFDLPR